MHYMAAWLMGVSTLMMKSDPKSTLNKEVTDRVRNEDLKPF